MFVLFRALIYASLFVGFLFIYLPARLLAWTGIALPAAFAWPQLAGLIVGTAGATIALWCVFAFVWIGKGTPAPFDPPRRLVIRGPYRFVRNPMYIGAGLTLAGAALYCGSIFLLLYGCVLLIVTHLVVMFYEEPTLCRSFGAEYQAYCSRVSRWRPNLKPIRTQPLSEV